MNPTMNNTIKKVKTCFPNILNFSTFFLLFENASGLKAIKKPIIPDIAKTKQNIKSNIIIRLFIMIIIKSALKVFLSLNLEYFFNYFKSDLNAPTSVETICLFIWADKLIIFI